MPQSPDKPAQRIAKLLARAGVASRREVERMIAEGRIARDGVPLDTAATVLTSLHGITVDGSPVQAAQPARLFRFHKPPGFLTAERDPQGRPTIYDRLPKDLPRVVPVGRLDLNTEGLLLLTTDGELKRQLELPATGVERSYRARAYGPVTQAQLEDLIHGVEIEGMRYGQIDANLERRTGTNVWIEMTLREGKNREVRRVLEHLGLRVSRLIRTRYGPFHLADLGVGEVEEVRQHDLVEFRRNPGVLQLSGGGMTRAKDRPPAPQPVRIARPAARPAAPRPAAPAAPRSPPAPSPAAVQPRAVERPAPALRAQFPAARAPLPDARAPARKERPARAATGAPRTARSASFKAAHGGDAPREPAPATTPTRKVKRFYDAPGAKPAAGKPVRAPGKPAARPAGKPARPAGAPDRSGGKPRGGKPGGRPPRTRL